MEKTFSLRLCRLRRGLFLSQAEIAQRLGIAQQSWQRYEKGLVQPSVGSLHQICEAFSVSADWLLGFSEVQRLKLQRRDMVVAESDSPAYGAKSETPSQWERRARRAEVKVETLERELDKQRTFIRELLERLHLSPES